MESAVFGLIGVAVGVFLTAAKDWWIQTRKDKKNAEYLAIQVSCRLERFIADCAGVAGDDGLCEGQTDKDGYHSIQVESPSLSLNDLKVEWKILPASLMHSILRLPYEAELVAQKTIYEFNHAFPPDYSEAFEERQLQYSKLGVHAALLLKQLLNYVDLPEAKSDEWDPIAFMRERKAEIDGIRQKRASNNKNLF